MSYHFALHERDWIHLQALHPEVVDRLRKHVVTHGDLSRSALMALPPDVPVVIDSHMGGLAVATSPGSLRLCEQIGHFDVAIVQDILRQALRSSDWRFTNPVGQANLVVAYIPDGQPERIDSLTSSLSMIDEDVTCDFHFYLDNQDAQIYGACSPTGEPDTRICTRSLAELMGERGRWPFDVLICDMHEDSFQPIVIEALSKSIPVLFRRAPPPVEACLAPIGDFRGALALLDNEIPQALMDLVDGANPVHRHGDTSTDSGVPSKAALLYAEFIARLDEAAVAWTAINLNGNGLDGLAWMTRWNVACGIAGHAARQVKSLNERQIVLAPFVDEPELLQGDEAFVFRSWVYDPGAAGRLLQQAADVVVREGIRTVIIHVNWAFFDPSQLAEFISYVQSRDRTVFLAFHSTASEIIDFGWQLAHYSVALRRADRVLVHQVVDAERVLDAQPFARVILEPHAMLVESAEQGPLSVSNSNEPLVSTFGFCLPNKGLEEIVLAIAKLRDEGTIVHLLMLNAEHPDEVSGRLVQKIRKLIRELSLSEQVTLIANFLPEQDVISQLSRAHLIVNPYQETSESASGSVRVALVSRKPVLVTPLPIFDDLGDAVLRTKGTSIDELADGIRDNLASFATHPEETQRLARTVDAWLEKHNLAKQTRRLSALARRLNAGLSLTTYMRDDGQSVV